MPAGRIAQGKPSTAWSGRNVERARAYMVQFLGAQTCEHCGRVVDGREPWVVGHVIARGVRPDLTMDPTNWRLEHRACSDRTGQAGVIAKARADEQRKLRNQSSGQDETTESALLLSIFPDSWIPAESPPFSAQTNTTQAQPYIARADLSWDNFARNAPSWYDTLLEIPEDAAPPLAISPSHPDAVGTLGWDAIAWVRDEMHIDLRWWQKLAFVHDLEVDDSGILVWRTVLESAPRRSGKSVRLRSKALWRISGQHDFGEPQTVLHTGKDVGIVREIHRQAWSWASGRGWELSRGYGQEQIANGLSRWLVRSTEGVYGYDVSLGMVDEAWAVEPMTFEEGLEPATMERESPQTLLTSTAHRRATKLMRNRLSNIMNADDGQTLVLLWGASPDDDPADPRTWRKASPHWSRERHRMIEAKYLAAAQGQQDAEFDDVDPMQGFIAQYLNVWTFAAVRITPGSPLVTDTRWNRLRALERPARKPDAVAVESWFNEGVSVVNAWRNDNGTVTVECIDTPNVTAAAETIATNPPARPVLVGANLTENPSWTRNKLRVEPATTTVSKAAALMETMLSDDRIRWTPPTGVDDQLTLQVLDIRTKQGADGPRIVSTGRADAIKATIWATQAASAKRASVVIPTRFQRRDTP